MRNAKGLFSILSIVVISSVAACGSSDTSSVDTSSVDTSSVDTSSVDTSSVDTSSVDTSSVDTSSDTAVPPVLPISVNYETETIQLISSSEMTVQGTTVELNYYENSAYKCGRTGNFGFLVVQRVGQTRSPLWITIRGGGIGYYDENGVYHGPEANNDAEGANRLAAKVSGFIGGGGNPQNKVAGRRFLEGYRLMMPSLCDHDGYAGMGYVYPNNPNYGTDGDTVDGLLANMAAVDFVVNGSSTLSGYPTGHVFAQGASAGSLGAYHLVRAFRDQGVIFNGAILDSFIYTDRYEEMTRSGCTPPSQADSSFDYDFVVEKLGPFVTEADWMIERTIAAGFEVPLADVYASEDEYCCGNAPLLPQAAGFTTNCDYVHGPVGDLMAQHPVDGHVQIRLDAERHVVLNSEQYVAIADQVDAWLAAILATNPPVPTWPTP